MTLFRKRSAANTDACIACLFQMLTNNPKSSEYLTNAEIVFMHDRINVCICYKLYGKKIEEHSLGVCLEKILNEIMKIVNFFMTITEI